MPVYLKIISGIGQGQVLPVPNEQPITIGRSSQASFAFDDAMLSRKHCQVECRGALCRITDLDSRNGTYVNGQRISAVLIKPGDRIKIGSLLMEVAPASAVGAPPGAPGLGSTPASTVAVANCQICQRAIRPQESRSLKGRVVCPQCLDRYDVDEDMVEGFKILERLQTTGIGTVYKAKQLLMERLVVLKTVVTSGDADEKALRRFLREAKAGGRLSHPSIVELYDVNEAADLMYIVMEFVEGETIEQLLRARQGPLPGVDVVRWMFQIADALRYAHEQSIIHRDVKPHTIVVRREDNRAKLTDFTLAKNLERAGVSVITADGEAVQTPFYLPPEQVKSARAADVRSDIYSFAATFYHALTGQLPIPSRSYGEFIARVFTHVPAPITQVFPQAPPALSSIFDRCLKKEPEERIQTMAELQEELTPIARGLGAA
ncbi:MAG TPA: FHA domain-containing serine/threonine-protein kinase [Planctomycetota bacterium]|nr:FHA domain-containing serine/threonine-protein kinase [Planctomycetota bacterium]